MNSVSASSCILNLYQTGDRPVLLLCSDGYHYICKYKLPGYSANKLTNELVGAAFARLWEISTPPVSLVLNDPIIWDGYGVSHDPIAPLLGSRKMESVYDLSNYNYDQIKPTSSLLTQLLKIALFDIWIANEDRTCNNYNLLYDMRFERIVSIDYGGIFNSCVWDRPIYQLNESDSILSSDLFDRLKSADSSFPSYEPIFFKYVAKCKESVPAIMDSIPKEWKVEVKTLQEKLDELFKIDWINEAWETFKELSNN